MSSKLEINIRTLISHCEEIANANDKDWRLKKYIKSLDTMIKEFQEESDLSADLSTLSEYHKRCTGLKEKTNYVEPASVMKKSKVRADDANQVLKEIDQIQSAKYQNDLRAELIGKSQLTDGLRKRGEQIGTGGGDDMNQAVKYYGDLQEKLAEDMLSLTRSLKEQTQTANKIIKKDTEVVKKSTNLSDKNASSLNKEAEKLQDHSKKAWKCWMWIMIGLVMMIFICKFFLNITFYGLNRRKITYVFVLFSLQLWLCL